MLTPFPNIKTRLMSIGTLRNFTKNKISPLTTTLEIEAPKELSPRARKIYTDLRIVMKKDKESNP